MPCHKYAAKKRRSGKKSTSNCITHYFSTPVGPEENQCVRAKSAGRPGGDGYPIAVRDEGRDLPRARRSEAGEPCPVEGRSGIGLAAGCDVAVADEIRDWIGALKRPDEPREHRVLGRCIREIVGSLELDADREVVAALAALPRRDSGVPCAIVAPDELHELTVAPDQEMRGDAQIRDRGERRMRVRIEGIGEETRNRVAAECARRQRDSVHD